MRLPVSPPAPCISDTPVMWPPGRARLATKPSLTGSPSRRKRWGSFAVVSLIAVVTSGADRDQHVRPQLHQLGRETGDAIRPALREAIIDHDVLSVDVAELLQSLAKSVTSLRIAG